MLHLFRICIIRYINPAQKSNNPNVPLHANDIISFRVASFMRPMYSFGPRFISSKYSRADEQYLFKSFLGY